MKRPKGRLAGTVLVVASVAACEPRVVQPTPANRSVASASSTKAAKETMPTNVSILEAALYGQSQLPDVALRPGWLALCQSGESFELRGVAVKVEDTHDEVVDEPGQRSAKLVSAGGCGTSSLLVRGDGLKPGPIRVGVASRDAVTFLGSSLQLTRKETSELGPAGDKATLLELKAPGASTIISRDRSAKVVWVGDIDRDQRADLVVSENMEALIVTSLFLSSWAGPGETVRLAATTSRGGC